MSPFRLILLSARYFWKMNAAVACGVAVAAAVLTGALLVGDSMQGSLRDLALGGLGRIEQALVANHLFREQLAVDASRGQSRAAPVILLRASIESADREPTTFANQVNLIGCDERFWQLGDHGPPQPPQRNEVVLSEPVARLLGVKVGDAVIVRLPRLGAIPAEFALGRKRDTIGSARLTVSAILATDGLGRFSLRPTQQSPRNAYMALGAVQMQLDEPGRANAIFRTTPRQAVDWRPRLADYGIHVEASPLGYLNVTCEQMMLGPAMEKALRDKLQGLTVQPALTYLANTIACGDREIPYSTVAAIDFAAAPPLGPFPTVGGAVAEPLRDDEIALNAWAAQRLKARVGDKIRLTFFEPESVYGKVRQRSAEFRLAAVVQLSGAAADRGFAPTVRGLTDRRSIHDWDPPFPFESRRIHAEDDKYWKEYGTTPKAFVALAAGRKLWASRFGQTTSLRVKPLEGMTAEALQRRLDLDPVEQGLVFRPIRAQMLAASTGTTPFGGLFLAFSLFVIAAALMLVMLLFRLGIERRARHLGLLAALGFRQRQITRIVAGEGLLVAIVGSLIGAALGVGYAALMLAGLRTWWLPAVGTPLLALHVSWASPAIGFASGLLMAMVAIWLFAGCMGQVAPRRLLAGETEQAEGGRWKGEGTSNSAFDRFLTGPFFSPYSLPAFLLLLAVAPAFVLLLVPLGEDAKVGWFFGAGAIAMVSLLTLVYLRLRAGATGPAVAVGGGNLLRMARRNAARNPSRSALVIGLTAAPCFLIAAVSVFRVDPSRQTARDSGSGGFALIGQSDQPIFHDLNTPEGRAELGVSADDDALLAQCKVFGFRLKPGDDASCLNLYQPRQPRLLGAPRSFVKRGGFRWADAPAVEPGRRGEGQSEGVPVVLDQTTANYALGLWKGRGQRFEIDDSGGKKLTLVVGGLLKDSIFQGDLLVSEEALLRYDPGAVGYRYFLIEAPADKTIEVQQALQRTLGDYGFTAETTKDRLAALAAVQNTYLSTFQSLGGLGLLLGVVGLAVVGWRNVLERRGELALLRAAGFRARSLANMVALENVLLLALGLAVGLWAALVAVLPHLTSRGASLPLGLLAAIFATVFAAGILASLAAMRGALRGPILEALREER